jgi:hypothetical protein
MRSTFAVLAFATAFLSATSAGAERRMFIIANNADGYGVDRCLASGASCGAAIATAYCRAREFSQAVSYRKVSKNDITGAVPLSYRAVAAASAATTTSPSSARAKKRRLPQRKNAHLPPRRIIFFSGTGSHPGGKSATAFRRITR